MRVLTLNFLVLALGPDLVFSLRVHSSHLWLETPSPTSTHSRPLRTCILSNVTPVFLPGPTGSSCIQRYLVLGVKGPSALFADSISMGALVRRIKASVVHGRREGEKQPSRLLHPNPSPPGQGCSQINGRNSAKVRNDRVISKRLSGITVIMSKNREGQSRWPHCSTPASLLPREGCCVWKEAEGGRGGWKWEEERWRKVDRACLLTRESEGAAKG